MSGLVVASTFTGFGGTCRGWRDEGHEVGYANEIDGFAADAYELNGGCRVDRRSIEEVSGEDVAAACGGTPDVFEGSPPCQDFSTIGRRDLAGERAGLFSEWVRLAGEVGAPAVCAENVTGLVKGDALRRHFLPIVSALEGHGYRVAARVLDCSRLGVAQRRERVILVGLRAELGADPADAFPAPSERVTTLGDALPGVRCWAREGAPGDEGQHKFREAREYPSWEPLPTVCATGIDAAQGQFIRAVTAGGERRPVTVEELAAVSGFPAGFEVPPSPRGSERARVERAWRGFGNCWPPPAAAAVARGVAACLDAARSPA